MDKFYNQISDYINNRLSSSEKLKFEEAMSYDPSLSSAVENQDVLHQLSDQLIEEDITKQINMIRNESGNQSVAESKIIKPSFYSKMAIASSFIVLLGLGYLTISYLNSSIDTEELYANYYRPPVNETVRGNAAINQKKELPCDSGHNAMEAGDFKTALELFTVDPADINTKCLNKSEWYKSLTYLKAKEIEKLKETLKSIISNKNHLYFGKATELLNDLD